jgi:hypothetical protein
MACHYLHLVESRFMAVESSHAAALHRFLHRVCLHVVDSTKGSLQSSSTEVSMG